MAGPGGMTLSALSKASRALKSCNINPADIVRLDHRLRHNVQNGVREQHAHDRDVHGVSRILIRTSGSNFGAASSNDVTRRSTKPCGVDFLFMARPRTVNQVRQPPLVGLYWA